MAWRVTIRWTPSASTMVPLGVIAQFGGQTPLNLSADLEKYGVKILGTSPEVIDMAEDRDLFRAMMDKLGIPMPEAGMAVDVDEALAIAEKIGYPVMVRPSYVIWSGEPV